MSWIWTCWNMVSSVRVYVQRISCILTYRLVDDVGCDVLVAAPLRVKMWNVSRVIESFVVLFFVITMVSFKVMRFSLCPRKMAKTYQIQLDLIWQEFWPSLRHLMKSNKYTSLLFQFHSPNRKSFNWDANAQLVTICFGITHWIVRCHHRNYCLVDYCKCLKGLSCRVFLFEICLSSWSSRNSPSINGVLTRLLVCLWRKRDGLSHPLYDGYEEIRCYYAIVQI